MQTSFYEPRFKDSKIVAFADVDVIDGVTVKGFRIVNGEKGLFVSVPSRGVQVSGATRYMHLVTFATPEIKERFLGEVMAAYERWEREREREREHEGGAATSASG